MQLELQHADPHADPHDSIAAQLRDLAPRLAHDPSEFSVAPVTRDTPAASQIPASEPSLRVAPLNDNAGDIRNPIPRVRSGRIVARVLLIACAGAATMIAWHFYGAEAKRGFSHLAPQFLSSVLTSTQSTHAAKPPDAASQAPAPQPAVDQALAQDAPTEAPATPTQSATTAATPAVASPPAQATIPPELAQSIELMAREIASMKQTVEQLQAGQQQLIRDVAADHETRRKLTAQPSKPRPSLRPSTPAAIQRTLTPSSPPQANPQRQIYPQAAQRDVYSPPPAPAQLPPQPNDASAPRPPMPLR